MKVPLARQVQEFLGQNALVIITERGDDVALLIGQMVKMGLVEVLDRHIPRHWTQRGISWGWTADDLAGLYPHGRRPPEGGDGGLHQGDANDAEPPERSGHRPPGLQ